MLRPDRDRRLLTTGRGIGRLTLASVFAASLLAGCGGGVPKIEDFGARGGDRTPGANATIEERANAFVVDHDAFASIGYRIDWRGFPSVMPGERIRSMDVLGDVLVVQESGSSVTLMEPETGEVRWSNQLAGPLTLFVGTERIRERLYVASEPELYVLALDTGALLERQTYEKVVSTKPIPVGRVLIFGTPSGEILAHLIANGVKYWGFDGNDSIEYSPVRVGRSVAAVTRSGDVLFVNAENGALLGRSEVFRGPGAELGAGVEQLYVASLDRSLYAFSPEGAELRWRYRTDSPLRDQPVEHEGVVYVAVASQGVVALDAGTGDVLWRSTGVGGSVVGVRGGRLTVWDSENRKAYSIDPASGEVVGQAELPGVRLMRQSPFLEGPLYVASDSGVIARFRPRF